MSDEDRPYVTPLDGVELAHAMVSIAAGARGLYSALLEEGLPEDKAWKATLAYLHGLAGGKFSA